jgi:hypothetical protein
VKVIQFLIAREAAREQRIAPRAAEPVKEELRAIAEPGAGRHAPPPNPLSSDLRTAHYGRCVKTVLARMPAPEPDGVPSLTVMRVTGIVRSADARSRIAEKQWPYTADENQRMAMIEGQRETQLILEAESEARRRRIAQCEEEIRRIEARPDDVQERAYLVTMGVEDWRAEKRLLEWEAQGGR